MFIAVYYRVIFILSPVSFFNLTILYRQGLFLSACFLAFIFLHKKRGRCLSSPLSFIWNLFAYYGTTTFCVVVPTLTI